MTMASRTFSEIATPALLLVGGALASANWYVAPDRAFAWATALAFLVVMACAWALSSPPAMEDEHAGPRIQDSIRSGVTLTSLMLVVPLGLRLASAMGILVDPDVPRRGTMAMMGLFFVFLGNAMPKTLTPLSQLRCSPARVQAFQRFNGWTWTLAGLLYALAWLTLPMTIAKPASAATLLGAILIVMGRGAQQFWPRRREV
jgi:hypothetical protein